MKRMMLTALFVLLAAGLSIADDNAISSKGNKVPGAVWIEGGAPIGQKGAASVAMGIRFSNVGVKLGYGGKYDYRSQEVRDSYPIDAPSILGMNSQSLGRKHIDPSWGFDFLGFYDLTKSLAMYGEVGAYLQEVRNVRVVTGLSQSVQNWGPGQLYNVEAKKQELSLAGGGGLQYRLFHLSKLDLLITAGYHTVRGVSGGLGFAW
jgi:hypothetical protein